MTGQNPVEPGFEELIRHIQESRGIDFRGYKVSSLRRRLLHRMQELHCDGFASYHALLEADPQEFTELLNTVLINVTSFFRDAEAWKLVGEQVVPEIVARSNRNNSPIRVWSVGCASGEEPYSLAMLFAEALGSEIFCDRVKVYATDLDEGALLTARHAIYPPRDVEGVPPELLEKYFERTNNHYVVQRDLRKCVIFGRHNVVHDAPIGRIDLLVCRNLLIYLETETQNTVLPRLHYALAEGGTLFLGKAETQLARSRLFEPINLRHRLFRKVSQDWRRTNGGSITANSDVRQPRTADHSRIVDAVLDSSATAYLAVNNEGELVLANVAARRLLEVGESDLGRPFQDLAVSYRPAELRGRIEEAQRLGRTVRLDHQDYHRPPNDAIRLSIEVTPLLGADLRRYATLIAFTDTTRTYQLQKDLEASQESLETTVEELQSANEELETTNEELQSTNEELETTNEELQSTNEELETMNEELRSTNEELEAANEELRRQSDDAAEYRRYAESLLRSVEAGIIVLDAELKVRSWNRWSENAWGLRAEEVLGEDFLQLDIGLPTALLHDDLQLIVQGDMPYAETMQEGIDRRGRLLRCRIRLSPLLYTERKPRGAVLVIEDVTETARNEDFTRYLGRIIGESLNEVYFLDPATLQFTLVNRGAERKLGYTLAQLRRVRFFELLPEVSEQRMRDMLEPLLTGEREELVFEAKLRNRAGREHPAEFCMQHVAGESPPILVVMVHDVSERQSALPPGEQNEPS